MLAGTQCTQIVNEAAQNGMKSKAKYLFMPQTCPGASYIGKAKLGGDGSAGDGWWILSPGLKDMADPTFQSDPYVMWLRGAMQAKGINPDSSVYLSGGINYGFGYTGVGYEGGYWRGREFYYNRSVTNINTTNITNVIFQG